MPDSELMLDAGTTALVLIDLQQGVVGLPVAPHSGPEIVARAARLAERFRALGAPVILVRVAFSADGRDRLTLPVDAPPPVSASTPPPGWSEIVAEIGPRAGDLVVTKRQWGAFYGTDLDMQLRRRGVTTLVLGGIATNFGVESTARDAYERGYAQVLVEDAMARLTAAAHAFAVETIFPRLGRIRATDEVMAALREPGVDNGE